MRRRIVIVAIVLMMAVSTVGFANSFGIGGAFSIDTLGGLPNSAMLSLKIPQLPIVWGIGARIGTDYFDLGLTADWWLYHQNLVSFIGLYVGPGLYLTLPQTVEVGGRIPIGINAFPLDILELFLEIAPTLLFFSSDAGVQIPRFGLQGSFGFRFWFDL